jgi:kynureninase
MGLDLITPRAETARGGSVMLRLPDSHPAPQIVAALRAAGIATDGRGQILRTSPGPVTTDDGVQTLVTALRHLLHS